MEQFRLFWNVNVSYIGRSEQLNKIHYFRKNTFLTYPLVLLYMNPQLAGQENPGWLSKHFMQITGRIVMETFVKLATRTFAIRGQRDSRELGQQCAEMKKATPVNETTNETNCRRQKEHVNIWNWHDLGVVVPHVIMDIIFKNYPTRSSVVRDDECNRTLAGTDENRVKLRIGKVANTLEIRSFFLVPRPNVARQKCTARNQTTLIDQDSLVGSAGLQRRWCTTE